jgi:hypothetical protein
MCLEVPDSSCVSAFPHGRGLGPGGETAAEPSGSGNGRLIIRMPERLRLFVARIVATGHFCVRGLASYRPSTSVLAS